MNTWVRSNVPKCTQKSLREWSPPSWIRTNPVLMPHISSGQKWQNARKAPHTGDSKNCQYGDKTPLKPHISRGGEFCLWDGEFCLWAIWDSLPCTGTYYTPHQVPRAQHHFLTVPVTILTALGHQFRRLTYKCHRAWWATVHAFCHSCYKDALNKDTSSGLTWDNSGNSKEDLS